MSDRLAVAWTRRSVEKDVKRWEEYPRMIELYNDLAAEGGDIQMVFATAFLTGGRITEVLNLGRHNFLFYPNHQPPHVKIIDMLLLKHYRKESEYEEIVDPAKGQSLPTNVLKRLYRFDSDRQVWARRRFNIVKEKVTRNDFAFRMDEPFVDDLRQWLGNYEGKRYIFPSRIRETGHLSRSFIYKRFVKHGIYPHWVRAQRASNLRTYHGLSVEDLMDWFTWLDFKTAMRYARMGTEEILGKFKPVSW